MMRHSLVVATTNRGKLEELRSLFAGLPLTILSIDDVLAKRPTVVEDGTTFEANAIKKARAIASASAMLTLADDSGLEVDALGGAPGVHSARFAHARATDAENNARLLASLEALDPAAHPGGFRARFRCVLALVDPFASGEPILAEGSCEGTILRSPRGSQGFGYDPLFLVDGSSKTMAELDADEKNRVSHRARAALALRPKLEELLARRERDIDRISRV